MLWLYCQLHELTFVKSACTTINTLNNNHAVATISIACEPAMAAAAAAGWLLDKLLLRVRMLILDAYIVL